MICHDQNAVIWVVNEPLQVAKLNANHVVTGSISSEKVEGERLVLHYHESIKNQKGSEPIGIGVQKSELKSIVTPGISRYISHGFRVWGYFCFLVFHKTSVPKMDPEKLQEIDMHGTIVIENGEIDIPQMNEPPDMLDIGVETTGDIAHVNGDRKAGFDLTKFGSAKEFNEILEAVDLDYYWNYYRIERNVDGIADSHRYFIWANEDGMIMTQNNPLTGEISMSWTRKRMEGSAGYIGIEGTKDFVDAAFALIEKNAKYKDKDMSRRSFI